MEYPHYTQAVDDRLPAYLQLRDRLAGQIAAGTWRVDEALPSENVLAQQTGLSVGTVRRAMQALVDEGLLERRRGSGTFLKKPAFDASLFRFFSVQLPDGQGTIPSSRLTSRQIAPAPAPFRALFGNVEAIHIERLRGVSGQVLLAEDIWIPSSRFAGFESMPEAEIGPLLYPVYMSRFGVLVARIVDDVSFATADGKMAERLGLPQGAPLAVVERIAYAADGTPVEWRVACGSATWFRYRSRIGPG
jgi:GntR family transcriptional regulator